MDTMLILRNNVFFLAKFCQLASFDGAKQHGFVKMDGFEPSISP
jgi:hypothetical protein